MKNHTMDNRNMKKVPGYIVKYFLEGLFILLPLTITISAIAWLVSILTKQLGPNTVLGGYLKTLGIKIAGDSALAYSIGWLIVIVFIFLLGFVVDIGAKKYIKWSIDLIMKRLPLINKLYNISGQIVEMFNRDEQEEYKGMTVVYCFFGGEKGATFLALMPTKERYYIKDTEYNVILIPSAPVPVGGSMMLVPSSSIQPADISIEDFMQVYVSMGASSGSILPKANLAGSES